MKKLKRHPISDRYYKSRRSSVEPSIFFESPALSLLLQWCREVCAVYGVPVNNFSSSFSDGRVLCYLIHHYYPSLLPLELVENDTSFSHPVKTEPITQHHLNDETSQDYWVGSFSPCNGIDKEQQQFLNNEKSNFKIVAECLTQLGGIPLFAHCKDMSNTLPNEKVVITYVTYLCHQLLLLRNETAAAKCIQSAWRAYVQRRLSTDLSIEVKQHLLYNSDFEDT